MWEHGSGAACLGPLTGGNDVGSAFARAVGIVMYGPWNMGYGHTLRGGTLGTAGTKEPRFNSREG